MTAIGSYQAKTHLPELLGRVAKGEKILITKRGVPVALLTQPPQQIVSNVRQVVEDMLAYRDEQKRTLGADLTTRAMIEEGRRFSFSFGFAMAKKPKAPSKKKKRGFVLDGSVALAWCFYDESDPYADAVAQKFPQVEAVVPAIWHLEVRNAFLVGERRGRSTQADTAKWTAYLAALSITADEQTGSQAFADILAIARAHTLSAYDASYIELALRRGLPLATLDARLRAAATAAGVAVYAS